MIITKKPTTDYLKIEIKNGKVYSNATEETKHYEQMLLEQYKDAGYTEDMTFGLDREPEFKYRGMMLDTVRHFFPVEAIKRVIYLISHFGGNVFHWHLTDDQGWRFEVPGYEKCITVGSIRKNIEDTWMPPYGGYYTDDEIRDVVKYAESRGVTIVPEIETPGHATAIVAAYPEFGCTGKQIEVETGYGVFNDVLNPASDAVYKFLETAIAHLVSLFPGPYIHIGGDECPHVQWENNKEIQELMKKEGLKTTHELQGWMVSKVAYIVEKYGKRPIAWDELLESPNIPSSLIIMNWRSSQLAIDAAKRGHDVIMSPLAHSYLDYSQNKSPLEMGNINVATVKDFHNSPLRPEGLTAEEQKHIIGGQCNLWCEKVQKQRQAEYMMFPRMLALFEALENYSSRDWDSFKAQRKEVLHLLQDSDIVCYPGIWEE